MAISTAPLAACSVVLDLPEVHRGDCGADEDFTKTAPVAGLAPGPVQSAQLSHDELTVVFSQITPGRYGDLYIAHRDHLGQAFGDATALEEVSSELDELTGSLSDDLRTLYFDREVQDRQYQMFMATRATPQDTFAAPVPVSLGEPMISNYEPFLTIDGLYFGSTRRSNLSSLYIAPGSGPAFGPVQRVASIETVGSGTAYENPVLSADRLTIYFGANPDRASAKQIWIAHRATTTAPFDPPQLLTSVNNVAFSTPNWLSPDSCRLYFMAGPPYARTLWVATRRE
jgi:hypothetical protein